MDHKKHAKKVHGHHVTHEGKMHQLYHHQHHGYGIFDTLGNWVSKAYDFGKKVHSHLKEKQYAKKILDNPYSGLIQNIPVVGSHLHSGLSIAAQHGYGEKLKKMHVPMVVPLGKGKTKKK